jgi:N-acetylmuramoyl-L-alanine amidase
MEPAVPGAPLPFPAVDGALSVKVVYPPVRHVLTVRDSTFIFGSVGSGRASLTINGAPVTVNPNGSFLAYLPVPRRDAPRYELVAAKDGDTARVSHEIAWPSAGNGAPAPQLVVPATPKFVELLNGNEDAKADTDAVTILRPTQSGTYKWFLHPGTVVELTGERGAWSRVRLDAILEAWVESKFTRPAARTSAMVRTARNARVTAAEGWSDLRIPLSERVPFLVEERMDAYVLTLYGTASDIDIVNLPTNDVVIRDVTWEQVATDRVRVTVHLRHAPYGYLALWDRGAFLLRVRKPPVVANRARPLDGRVIAVDAGHPPIGSTGPTGLYEGDATLMVANALKPLLEAAGATVVMTRTAPGPVALGERPITARHASADVFVSIHLNAHPDGVNPYRTNGSGTYYFHTRAEPLARAVQRGLVRWMGLRDLGVNYDNLAVVRPTWFPAVLCEGAFVILPDQEAALRTSDFQARYAMGILEGLEEYFRDLGTR